MTQYEMTEKISEKCNVTLEEAKAALEAGEWNMLTAAQSLEQEKLRRLQELDEVASSCAAAVAVAPVEAAGQGAEAEAAESVEPTVQAESADAAEPGAKADKAEREKAAKRDHGQGLRNLDQHVRRLLAFGNRNRLVVRKGDETLVELPVTVLALALLCAFWVCLPLMVLGLFVGCRYSFSGKELGREGINSALGKAADAAEQVKHRVAEA